MAAPAQAPSLREAVKPTFEVLAPRRGRRPGIEPNGHVPAASYRIQFGPGFGFPAARKLVPFLHRLGVSHVYSSPIFAARKGSTHGYDVTNPLTLNPELGTAKEFDAFIDELKRHGMGLILDIVPNHMAASTENQWWADVLEDGRESTFSGYFDIDWNAAPAGHEDRVVLPVLGAPYRSVLENAELRLAFEKSGFVIRYWEHRFPVDPRSWRALLCRGFPAWSHSLGATHPAAISLWGLLKAIERLPALAVAARSRFSAKQAIKATLWELYQDDDSVRRFVDGNLQEYNGRKGEPDSFGLLDGLLSRQHYLLAHWRTGREQVNYRRFFDINDLVGVRVEDEEVFAATHAFVIRLFREGKIAGLRLDHIDGLHDPLGYLRRLQECLASPQVPGKPYIIAEKITIGDEALPGDWPVCGTTGYDFLNAGNAVFADGENIREIEEIYSRFTGIRASFGELVYHQKKRVARDLFGGELFRLSTQLQTLAASHPHACEARREEFAAAIEEVTARLPVYRTYVRSHEVPAEGRKAIASACEAASSCAHTLPGPALDFLRRVLLLQFPDWLFAEERRQWQNFVMRWQQFTGPLMAKGMEDTACYVYNRLVSLNVVGGGAQPVSVEEFHRFNQERSRNWPFCLNATSTHDTKRSEDVRARINVLSEIPGLWGECLERWSRWNLGKKRRVGDGLAPDANDEILLYQVLLGAWPLCEDELPEFQQRIRGFAIKAAREAKTRTNWLSPDLEYEQALLDFIDGILAARADNPFLPDFLQIQRRIAPFGAIGSLAQLLLKITSPGVPDFYQGTLLWDFSLVDPDNRRPVDFAKRMRLFEELRGARVEDLLANWTDGRIKLYTAAKALDFRQSHRELFASGDYVPLDVSGPAARHVIAFARRKQDRWALVAVPRLIVGRSLDRNPFADSYLWKGTKIRLPEGAPGWWQNLFTGEVTSAAYWLPVSTVFGRYPVALLSAGACV